MKLEQILRRATVGLAIISMGSISGCGSDTPNPDPNVHMGRGNGYIASGAGNNNLAYGFNTEKGDILVLGGTYRAHKFPDGSMDITGTQPAPTPTPPNGGAPGTTDPCSGYLKETQLDVKLLFENKEAQSEFHRYQRLIQKMVQGNLTDAAKYTNLIKIRDYALSDEFNPNPLECGGQRVISLEGIEAVIRAYEQGVAQSPPEEPVQPVGTPQANPQTQEPEPAPVRSPRVRPTVSCGGNGGGYYGGGVWTGRSGLQFGDAFGRSHTPYYSTGRSSNFWSPQSIR